jgi:hypothetical protein
MVKGIRSHNRVPVLLFALLLTLFGVVQVVLSDGTGLAGNISPVDKWAWGTNVGWLNFDPSCSGCEGVTVYPDHLEGYAWGENIGWIRMGSHSGGGTHTYGNTSATNYGVNRAADGTLSGYAWATNVGWINLDPAHGGVTIDPATGSFEGYSWAENVGWIRFKGPGYNVVGPAAKYRVYLPGVLR